MQGVVISLVIALLQISWRISRLRNFKNRLRFDNRGTALSLVSPFLLEHGVNDSVASVLFCSLAVMALKWPIMCCCAAKKLLTHSLAILDPRVGHTMDILSPFIPILCHSD